MPAPAVIVNVFGKVDGFLTGWGPTRNPEGPKMIDRSLLKHTKPNLLKLLIPRSLMRPGLLRGESGSVKIKLRQSH